MRLSVRGGTILFSSWTSSHSEGEISVRDPLQRGDWESANGHAALLELASRYVSPSSGTRGKEKPSCPCYAFAIDDDQLRINAFFLCQGLAVYLDSPRDITLNVIGKEWTKSSIPPFIALLFNPPLIVNAARRGLELFGSGYNLILRIAV